MLLLSPFAIFVDLRRGECGCDKQSLTPIRRNRIERIIVLIKRIYNGISEDIKQACEVMERGGVILYPTDTIWGIGCDATNAEAVNGCMKSSNDPTARRLSCSPTCEPKVEYYVSEVPETGVANCSTWR